MCQFHKTYNLGDGVFLNLFTSNQFVRSLSVVYNMGVLKHFAPVDTFRSGGIEKFCPRGHILVWRYWKILPPGLLKNFESKIYKDFELYQVFMQNWFKYFETFWSKKIRQENLYTIFCSKMFQYPPYFILPTHIFTTPQWKSILFLFYHVLTLKMSIIFQDATLLTLIL